MNEIDFNPSVLRVCWREASVDSTRMSKTARRDAEVAEGPCFRNAHHY